LRISASEPTRKVVTGEVPKDALYEVFLEDATSKGLVPPEDAKPCLMFNDANNTEQRKEYVFRMWNTETHEWQSGIYLEDEAGEVFAEALARQGVRLPQTIGSVSIHGFQEDGSGYIEGDSVEVTVIGTT